MPFKNFLSLLRSPSESTVHPSLSFASSVFRPIFGKIKLIPSPPRPGHLFSQMRTHKPPLFTFRNIHLRSNFTIRRISTRSQTLSISQSLFSSSGFFPILSYPILSPERSTTLTFLPRHSLPNERVDFAHSRTTRACHAKRCRSRLITVFPINSRRTRGNAARLETPTCPRGREEERGKV